jgi:hypothetical protein
MLTLNIGVKMVSDYRLMVLSGVRKGRRDWRATGGGWAVGAGR